MTITKVKKDGINITIENNLFSKNKTSEKKNDDIRTNALPKPSNPFEPEPAFLGEIRNRMAEKRFYQMRINPVRPMFNDMNMVHSKIMDDNDTLDEEVLPSSPSNEVSGTPDVLFDENGTYVGSENESDRRKAINRLEQIENRIRTDELYRPRMTTLVKYGLQRLKPNLFS